MIGRAATMAGAGVAAVVAVAIAETPRCVPVDGRDEVVAVSFEAPDDSTVAGVTFELEYPPTKVELPGDGTSVPPRTLTDAPPGAVVGANDLGHMVRATVARADAMPAGPLVRLHFRPCAGAPRPTAGELACRVVGTSDVAANPVAGVTCAARPVR